jgi:hypothetical protein
MDMPSVNWLEPRAYDEAEQAALIDRAALLIQAFRPLTFERLGFPTRIVHPREMLRFADHNLEPETAALFRPGARFDPAGYVNSFTADEYDLMRRVGDRVSEETRKQLGRALRPVTTPLVNVGPFRAMHHLARLCRRPPLTVFEVGAGSGYLGAFLAMTGFRYLSYDVTQGYYLWQSFLLDIMSNGEFSETAALPSFPAAQQNQVVHLPWWQYTDMLTNPSVSADVVYSNANLGEMSLLSLKHVLHISRFMLKDSPIGVFMYLSTGMLAQNSLESLAVEFNQFGFRKFMDWPFHAFVQEGRDPSPVLEIFRDGIPPYDPSGRGGTIDATTAVTLRRSEAPLDATLAAWNSGFHLPYSD